MDDDQTPDHKLYSQAVAIKEPAEATIFFRKLVERRMRLMDTNLRMKAVMLERGNLGYYAGYYDRETRLRVEILYEAPHPILGTVEETDKMTAAEIMQMGMDMMSERMKKPKRN